MAATLLALTAAGLCGSPTPSAAPAGNWALDRINQRQLPLDANGAHGGTGTGVTIYVIDTGVRGDHEQFRGRIQSIGDFFPPTAPTSAKLGGTTDDCAAPDGHGTLNASLAAGSTLGVAPGATIAVLRAAGGAGCEGTADAARRAVDWITANGRTPAVVNLSFRFSDTALNEAIVRSMAAGFTYTLSAGTAGEVTRYWGTSVPALALVVASTDDRDTALRDDYGPALTLFAPAVSVTGASRRGPDVTTTPTRDRSGDSYAAPLVAGAAALYLEAHPRATPREVREALIANATTDVVRNAGQSPNRLLFLSR